ncbi:MAG TPA: pyruvate dehydrogenase (acetyl-transferring) E1 component subunit alpha [Sulfuricurvum sp.]|nr:MAG: pyruvate dehydrogenase (acetyl-transferring) E1 component subunit alpha [Campylobacterales bacterium 16-40-21]OZA03848.1 MAG: pyruvate dehydrogenase (acetyl-transferring) E1 component subunit alpha [Sulfuricurvum sp. 17-40-25]HQS65632.1 pyruvate dehydrogenase (acetyl-transferring) E1 component subunit alpha [Sulfuricurvum sp.]HQT36138.1 pyruvate dehydrogenase (acetyl-transferring) E1 component subunit alpha [Sulfuricurvum sp.]
MDLDLANTLYREMLLIRRFEEKCVEMYSKEKIRGFLHLYIGEEAVAVGVMHALNSEDAVFATYREHGHALARGVHPNPIMAELYGKEQGCSRGRGGSMHLFDAKTHFYGGIAIVTGGLPMAIGMALSDKMMKRNRVTVCFFGEGAVAEGEFHESLNLAALWHLPILFVCENNLYAMGTALEFTQSETNISLKAASYRITSTQIDGMNVTQVAESAQETVRQIRAGNGPVFLECLTYRFRAHSMYDAELYRQKSEVEEWKQKDPLVRLHQDWPTINIAQHEKEIAQIIDDAVEFAENGTLESVDDLEKFIYSSEVAP